MLCCSSLIFHLGPDTNIFIIATLNCIAGFGAGICGVVYTMVREYNTFYNCEDIATGLVASIVNVAGIVFQSAIGFLMDIHWTQRHGQIDGVNGKRIYTANDYEFAFISLDIAIGFAIIISLIVKETNGKMVEFKGKH
eukprot:838814_1